MKTYIEMLFNQFNNNYFGGKLPKIKVYYSSKHFNGWGRFDDEKMTIMLSPILKDYMSSLHGILLHEAVHVYLYVKHYPYENDSFWLDHTEEFLHIQAIVNKKHFGDTKGHTYHYDKMIKDLKRKNLTNI